MLQQAVATGRRKVWELCSKYDNDVASGCCNRQEDGMGIVLQQSHYNLEAMLQDGWTSNYKEMLQQYGSILCAVHDIRLPKLKIRDGGFHFAI